jgi:predicted PurR-regulated permease PerM
MTFAQLLIGFLILRIPYALTLAALIALIDILPVLGVGTVLVPWAILLLVRGDTYTGVGLLLMFGIIWIIRQISEPRIVGHSVGLSPLVTLIVMYAGYHFMGFGGLFVFPLVMILLKNLHDIGVLRLWRE